MRSADRYRITEINSLALVVFVEGIDNNYRKLREENEYLIEIKDCQ